MPLDATPQKKKRKINLSQNQMLIGIYTRGKRHYLKRKKKKERKSHTKDRDENTEQNEVKMKC